MTESTPPPSEPNPPYGQGGPPPPPAYGQPPQPQQPYGYAPPQGLPRPGELIDRFLARLIDGVILAIVYVILGIIFGAFLLNGFNPGRGSVFVYTLVLSLISIGLSLGYYAVLESSRGATLGKQLMKLEVFGPDGHSHPTLEQAVRRNIWLAAGLLRVVPFVGGLLSFAASVAAVVTIAIGINNDTQRRQAWHDHFAGGTQVMKVG